jgi:glycogen phosphorylase
MMTGSPLDMLPASIAGLRRLAFNLHFSWHGRTLELFRRIDPALWEATRHNPVRLLLDCDATRLDVLAHDAAFVAEVGACVDALEQYLGAEDAWYARRGEPADRRVAYFSAEFAIAQSLPIYSGGLGVLAGDHLKSASDLGIPLVAVGLFYREGYFKQHLDVHGVQHDAYPTSDPTRMPLTLERDAAGAPLLVEIPYIERSIFAQIWRADVGRLPLYLLDTDTEPNRPEDRGITNRLYGGDNEHRLRQEIVLGIGGSRALGVLGVAVDAIHLNEGHAAFAAVERVHRVLREHEDASFSDVAAALADGVVFTTHTPVPAGHDYFAPELLQHYLGAYIAQMREDWHDFLALGRHDPADPHETFCMTLVAMRLAGRTNGVSRLHGQVSRRMWRGAWGDVPEEDVPIGHITNGVHLPTWVARPSAELYERHIGASWQDVGDDFHWQGAAGIPLAELWQTRGRQRAELVRFVRHALAGQVARRGEDPAWTAGALDADALTIVFARRFATYKRATLLLSDPARLSRMLQGRPVQFIFAGKAHPRDVPGQEYIRRIMEFAARREHRGRFVFLEDYDVSLARVLVEGADVWLNVPRRPYEASGTSGMKAAANGALNLSIPDGWWAEAWAEHNGLDAPIGWSIEANAAGEGDQDRADAEALFQLLEHEVVPLFYDRDEHGLPRGWLERVLASVRQVVPFFNTHRMVRDYTELCYLPAAAAGAAAGESVVHAAG